MRKTESGVSGVFHVTDISGVIEALARRDPRAPAIVGRDSLDRAGLDLRTRRLARRLQEEGVRADDLVGLLLPRGTALAAAALGVLRSGGAYLPLDVAATPHRLATMAELVGLRWIATAVHLRPLAEVMPGTRIVEVDALWSMPDSAQNSSSDGAPDLVPTRDRTHPEDLAYTVFTSGSTGEPKPVAVPRRALSNHVAAICARYQLTENDRVLQFANPAFDVFAEELFPTLAVGASVVVAPDALPTPAELEQHIAAHGVTVVNLPTPYWTQWVRDLDARPRALPASLRLVVIGSEAGYADTLARWWAHSRIPLVNAYGLSETTVTAATARFGPGSAAGPGPLPIGHVIEGGRAHVLDSRMRPVPTGEVGELHLGGHLLARGYIGRPDLTAERFVPDPARPGARLYRTGDLVREGAGGLQFLGRDDGQVKIRGHRVEPLEVAAALTGHPDILQAHVEAEREQGQARLVAYVVPRGRHRVPTGSAIRAHLRDRLPDYSIPSAFAVLDALPCLPNGKIDRTALPPIGQVRPAGGDDYVAARTDLERRLADLWRDMLGLDRVGVTDDLFALGGHSLTAVRIAAQIQAEEHAHVTPVEVISTPTVEQLARLVTERRGAPPKSALPALAGAELLRAPLSRQQEQVWLHTMLAPDSIAYHAQTTIRLVGPFDPDLFDRVITELGRRHAILRTTYGRRDGALWQFVHDPGPVRATRIDLTHLPEAQREQATEELAQRELRRPFDLGTLPLLRWTSIRLTPEEHELVLVEHHMVHDGWSFALLMRELKALYNAYARGGDSPLAEPAVQYQDYAIWQQRELAAAANGTAVFARQLAYWREQLDGMPAPLALRPDRPRPTVQTYRGHTLRIELPPHLPAAVRAFCRTQRLTLFSAMYAAFVALLHRYTGERDICIGSAYANRQIPASQEVVGMFVNAVELRCAVAAQQPFADLARRAQEVVFAASQNQEIPFVELVRALNPQRDAAVQPMAQILFSVNDSPLPDLDLGAATGTVFERGNGSAKTDLDVVVIPRAESQTADAEHVDDRIMLLWEYNADLFDEHTMRQMASRYMRLLEGAVTAPATAVGDLPLADESGSRTPHPHSAAARPFSDVTRAVLDQAAATPEAIAVESASGPLRYRDLVDRAGRLASRLRAEGVASGQSVAVLLPRGAELVVAELGVLMAGAAFVPLDPATPAERIALCCADAGARYAVTDASRRATLPPGMTVLDMSGPDESGLESSGAAGPQSPPPHEFDPAYVIYTSGSTGTPKGVVIHRAALANLVGWHLEALELTARDRCALFASPAFDVSIGEIWPALAAGASLHVPDEESRLVPTRLRDWLAGHRSPSPTCPPLSSNRCSRCPRHPDRCACCSPAATG